MSRGEKLLVVDVREAFELQIAKFPDALHVPLAQVPAKLTELPTDRMLVMACHVGVRSMRALEFLKSKGYTQVRNLKGGIDAWSREVDPAVQRY